MGLSALRGKLNRICRIMETQLNGETQSVSESSSNSDRVYRTLALESRNGVDWLTLSRPERLNAVDSGMASELNDYFAELCDRPDARVVVLRGAGRHFCAGFDLDNPRDAASGFSQDMRTQRLMSEIVLRMRRCPQPIIACMHGAACGAGFALALAADVRYAAEDARMNVAMARIGLTGCDMGISYFLPRAVGSSNAAELMMSGRFVDAHRALRIGLVSNVVSAQALDATANELAQEMLTMSPAGLRLTKDGLAFGQDAPSLAAAVAMEDRGQVLCMGPFMQEGVSAFREKRAPRYEE
jgi:enoyl-CoA hydratase/carnithine racemase